MGLGQARDGPRLAKAEVHSVCERVSGYVLEYANGIRKGNRSNRNKMSASG